MVVLVCGAAPGQSLVESRRQIRDGIAACLPHAAAAGVKLAIEPLHPMYASDRCVVSTLTQALDLAERFPAQQVGVTVDTYHIWWDDTAPEQIARAGASGRIHTFQLADWTTPLPEGVLTGRGQIGDGSIDMREWKGYVEAAGYTGAIEVELFNDVLWARDGREVLAETAQRFVRNVIA